MIPLDAAAYTTKMARDIERYEAEDKGTIYLSMQSSLRGLLKMF